MARWLKVLVSIHTKGVAKLTSHVNLIAKPGLVSIVAISNTNVTARLGGFIIAVVWPCL